MNDTQDTQPDTPGRNTPGSAAAPVMIRELIAADRDTMRQHFLALDTEDRRLRFGQITQDAVIDHYVDGIDFGRDTVFGVFDAALTLVGVAHLAYMDTPRKARMAEFGVSVLPQARGRGVGSRLFERAAIHARNTRVTTLFMHYLSSNATMMHIARKAGMQIQYDHGEADAYLTLPPGDHGSLLTEMLSEQAALVDYAVKRQTRQVLRVLNAFWHPRGVMAMSMRGGD